MVGGLVLKDLLSWFVGPAVGFVSSWLSISLLFFIHVLLFS